MTDLADPDTDELLRRAAAGDAQAVQGLLDRHRERLLRMVAVRLDPRLAARCDASDVVQDALLEAVRRLPGYLRERPLPFYPWLRQLAWDRLVEVHRRHVRAGRRSINREELASRLPDRSADQLAERLLDSATGPGQALLRDELRARVREALARLEPKDREVLVLRHLEQLRVAEIAAVLGISEGAVKMRRLRAVQQLRQLLNREFPGSQP
jgi:RNA polymerase sigma-70 factor (ECF subfamily)